jgi:hypothetical protein
VPGVVGVAAGAPVEIPPHIGGHEVVEMPSQPLAVHEWSDQGVPPALRESTNICVATALDREMASRW